MTASMMAVGADKPVELNELQIRELVRQLGSDSFVAREQAGEMILRQGRRSMPALENGLTNPDYEVVRRSRILISLINEVEKKTRLQAFLEDADGSKNTVLPGWDRFEKLVGKGPASRTLYGQIYKSDPGLMDDVENDKSIGKSLISEKAQWLHNSIFSPVAGKTANLEIGEIGAVLFAATSPDMELPQEVVNNITNLLYQPSARDAISASKGTGPFRKLLATWMLKQTDPNIISQHLHLSQNMNMTEGLELARRAASEKSMPVYTKTLAFTLIGKMGTAEDTGLLRNHLSDETVVGNFQLPNQQKGTTQVRDVALAMLVHMSGQSHKDYGFSFANQNQALFFNPYMLGFTNQENRNLALKKWDTYFTTKPMAKSKS